MDSAVAAVRMGSEPAASPAGVEMMKWSSAAGAACGVLDAAGALLGVGTS